MKSIAIIGMNFGDEGKGHITNFFSDNKTLNVLFNGGAQRAHGVHLSNGTNHIFHHFGSGSLKGARTLLANKFIVNPIIFSEEFGELSTKTKLRKIFIDPRCLVSTHFDMLINVFASNRSGKNMTCGFGINETIERSQFRQLKISIRDLVDKTDDQLKSILKTIWNEWVPYRIDQLKLSDTNFMSYFKKRISQVKATEEQYLNVVKFMLSKSVIWPDDNLIDRYSAKHPTDKIVFEAGQGLLLDQRRKEYMPYLTRSNTGMKNVHAILKTVRTSIDLTAYLVTRTYLTRHGDGPLPNEFKLPHDNIDNLTNPDNKFQGPMRYGYLNKAWYTQAIFDTTINKNIKNLSNFEFGVAMTCLDHKVIDTTDFDHIHLTSNGPLEKHIKLT